MTQLLTPETSVDQLPGVGPKISAALERLGVTTIQQLLEYLPRRLEDRSQTRAINQLRFNEEVVITVTIASVHQRKSKRGTLIIQADGIDETGKIPILWFNQRYLLRQLLPGQTLKVFGAKKVAPALGNPFFAKTIVNEASILPVYRSTAALPQAVMRKLIKAASNAVSALPALLPEESNKKELLDNCHADPTEEKVATARRLLAKEELLLLGVALGKNGSQSTSTKHKVVADNSYLRAIVESLPYQLSDGQRKAAWEIINDLAANAPMRRVLYGEVGSGKTVIALLVAAAVIRSGQMVAILVPTTTLAEQQARVAKTILGAHNINVALVTSERKEDHTSAQLIIGTQALLQKQLLLPSIGLVIIDEQQRLGVRERQHLIDQNPTAHLLMMTATPIPRSLAHIIFGQMALSYLRGKPAHQLPVKTVVFEETNRASVEKEIAARVAAGEPGYVICPLIESSDDEIVEDLLAAERKAVGKEAKRLKERFPDFTIALLHGRLKGDQKTAILQKFRDNKIDILVSTTVVEVGIDNPNATWILIEEADIFGLATLHQLRGRVGRGAKASVCFLSKRSSITEYGERRLEAVATTTDGLALAEADLQLRGPGELTGIEQSGLPRLRYANWQDLDLVKEMFARAQKIVQDGVENYPTIASAVEKLEITNQIS